MVTRIEPDSSQSRQSEIPNTDEKLRALDQVLRSSAFERANQLKRFLRYIGELEIAGRADEIKEYTIGTEALGRPTTYSPGDDSSVRGRAHALRLKLAEFYGSEGADSPWRIELPKGSYVPHFIARTQAVQEIEPAPGSVRSGKLVTPTRAFAAGIVAAALVGIAAFTVIRLAKPGPVAPILQEFWGPLLQPGGDVLVCVAPAPSMLLKSYKEGTLPPEPRIVPASDMVAEWYAGLHMHDGGGRLYAQTSTNTVLFGDSLASMTAAKTLALAGKSVQVLPENSIRANAIRGRNVILIGSPNYSPFAARILKKMPFSVRYDPARKVEVISNDGSGESPVEFASKRDEFGILRQVYGLITVLPSQPVGEGSRRTVILSGITSAGTQAAMEFFSSPVSLRDLKARFGTAHSGALPASYQVVVRCGADNLLALNWTYETHRIVDKPPLVE